MWRSGMEGWVEAVGVVGWRDGLRLLEAWAGGEVERRGGATQVEVERRDGLRWQWVVAHAQVVVGCGGGGTVGQWRWHSGFLD